LRTLIAAFAIVAGFIVLNSADARAASLEIPSMNCEAHPDAPGGLSFIQIKNSGDTTVDLNGWRLVSDPEATEQMPLGRIGSLDPQERAYIVSGFHGTELPNENQYLWQIISVLRGSGTPPDYVRILDAAGNEADRLDCPGGAPSETASPTPAPATPAPTPAAAGQTSQPTPKPLVSAPKPLSGVSAPVAAASELPAQGGNPVGDGRDYPLIIALGGALAALGGTLVYRSLLARRSAVIAIDPDEDNDKRRIRQEGERR